MEDHSLDSLSISGRHKNRMVQLVQEIINTGPHHPTEPVSLKVFIPAERDSLVIDLRHDDGIFHGEFEVRLIGWGAETGFYIKDAVDEALNGDDINEDE